MIGSTDAATVVFQGNLTENNAAAMTIVLGDGANANTQAVTFDTAFAENLVIAATINDDNAGAADTSVVNVLNSNAGANTITFSDAFGTTQQIDQLNIGSATVAGTANFTANTSTDAAAITVTGGDAAAEDSSVEFQHSMTATFDANNGAQTSTGTIDGAADNEGTLNIIDADTDAPDLLTFNGIIGGTQDLKSIAVGNAADAGAASFGAAVSATTVTILGAESATETSRAFSMNTES